MSIIKKSLTVTNRQARGSEGLELQVIRAALIEAEKGLETNGYSESTVDEIIKRVLKRKALNAALPYGQSHKSYNNSQG